MDPATEAMLDMAGVRAGARVLDLACGAGNQTLRAALNEVRVLCNSLLFNHGKFQIEKLPGWPMSAGGTINLKPEKSLLGPKVGDDVTLSEDDFVRLYKAFFAEIEKKYL